MAAFGGVAGAAFNADEEEEEVDVGGGLGGVFGAAAVAFTAPSGLAAIFIGGPFGPTAGSFGINGGPFGPTISPGGAIGGPFGPTSSIQR